MAALLQYRAAALIARLQAAGTGGHHLAPTTTRIGSIVGTGDGRKAGHALRLKPDYLMGSGQMHLDDTNLLACVLRAQKLRKLELEKQLRVKWEELEIPEARALITPPIRSIL
jgi:hypothetical protein